MDGGGIGKFLVVWGVGTSTGEYGRSEKVWKEMWRNVLGCEEVWGKERGDVGEEKEMRREVWEKMGRGSHNPYIFLHFSHTPTHFPHISPHTSFHISPHIFPLLSPHFFSHLPHIFPLLSPHFLTPSIFPPYLTQLPKLPKISQLPHHPYSSKLPQIFYNPLFFFIIFPRRTTHSYFIIYPTPKLLTFLSYCQISSAIKYT